MIFLDCDGVLADFDGGARKVFGMHPAEFECRLGHQRFWAKLVSAPDFFANLELLPNAMELCEAVRHNTR